MSNNIEALRYEILNPLVLMGEIFLTIRQEWQVIELQKIAVGIIITGTLVSVRQ